MVIGKVNIWRIGFTVKFNKDNTTATRIALHHPVVLAPGKILDKRITNAAVINSLSKNFIRINFNKNKKTCLI